MDAREFDFSEFAGPIGCEICGCKGNLSCGKDKPPHGDCALNERLVCPCCDAQIKDHVDRFDILPRCVDSLLTAIENDTGKDEPCETVTTSEGLQSLLSEDPDASIKRICHAITMDIAKLDQEYKTKLLESMQRHCGIKQYKCEHNQAGNRCSAGSIQPCKLGDEAKNG